MTDNQYKTGDPVVDLAQGRPMVVLDAPDQTVDEWSDANNYNLTENYANGKLDPDPDESVVRCVYVSDIRSEPSKDYTFPVSRVALIDVHHADDGERLADRVTIETLAAVFRTLAANGLGHRNIAGLLAGEIDERLVDIAQELADVNQTIAPEAEDD
jgi:hypothetical protein